MKWKRGWETPQANEWIEFNKFIYLNLPCESKKSFNSRTKKNTQAWNWISPSRSQRCGWGVKWPGKFNCKSCSDDRQWVSIWVINLLFTKARARRQSFSLINWIFEYVGGSKCATALSNMSKYSAYGWWSCGTWTMRMKYLIIEIDSNIFSKFSIRCCATKNSNFP